MKLRDYEFKSIFNELKGIYPNLNLELKRIHLLMGVMKFE